MYVRGEPAWYLFSRKYDITGIGSEFLEQKANVLHIVQPITGCV